MAEAQKTEVLPSIAGFKKELDKATENSNIDREELDRLMIEYEKEKGAIKGETQGKIEAFFKNMVYTMLRTGGFKIINPEKDFVILGSLGYKEDINTLKTTYTEKKGKGSNWAIYEKDGKIAFKELLISSGKIGVVEYDKNNMDGLKRSVKTEAIFQSVKRIPGLEKTHELSDLNFIVKPNGSVQPSEGLSWIEDNNPENFDLKLKGGYSVKDGKIVKEEAVALAQVPAPEVAPAPKAKEKFAETPKKKKKPKESHPINGFETDDKLIGSTGKIKGMHVNLRKENGDRTGKTVSRDVSVNLTGRTGKRSINGKDIEYCEVILPGENTKYFVAKTYIGVGEKQIKSDVPAKLTGLDNQESSELPKKDQLSKENQDLLNANKSVEVGTYVITQGKVVGRDWDNDESGVKKTAEEIKKAGRETFSGKIELTKKDGKYILEMTRTGVFGLGNYTKELTDKMPTKKELEDALVDMKNKKQEDGLKNYAVTTGVYEVSTEIKKDI